MINGNRERKIVIILWCIILICHIFLHLSSPNTLSMLFIGFTIGGLFIMIMDNILFNYLERLLNRSLNIHKKFLGELKRAVEENKSKKKK